MQKIEKYSRKFRFVWFGIIGALISIVTLAIAVYLYMLSFPNFNIIENYISDLGDGPNNSNLVFNTGVIISGIFFIIFYISLFGYLRSITQNKAFIWISFLSTLISGIGWILVGIFTDQKAPDLHIFAAALYFLGSCMLGIFYSIIERNKENIPKRFCIMDLIVALLFALFLFFYLFKLANSGYLEEVALFFEWISYFALMIWISDHSIYTIQNR